MKPGFPGSAVLLLSLFLVSGLTGAGAQESHSGESGKQQSESSGSLLYPEPAPFSLDTGSAHDCIALLKGNRYLEKNGKTEAFEVVQVETVWSWFLSYDEAFPRGHRLRYDIIVNGDPLNWENSYIEYGSEIINLKLLFLYRNQHPASGSADYLLKDF